MHSTQTWHKTTATLESAVGSNTTLSANSRHTRHREKPREQTQKTQGLFWFFGWFGGIKKHRLVLVCPSGHACVGERWKRLGACPAAVQPVRRGCVSALAVAPRVPCLCMIVAWPRQRKKRRAKKHSRARAHTQDAPRARGRGGPARRRRDPPLARAQRRGTRAQARAATRNTHAGAVTWTLRITRSIDRSKERLDPKTPKGRSHHPTACAQCLFGGSGQQGTRKDTRCGHSRAKHTQVGAWKGSGRTRSSLYQ